MIKKRVFFGFLFLWVCLVSADSFEYRWREMQQEYERILRAFPHSRELEKKYMHPHWQNQTKLLAQTIRGKEDCNILRRGPVAGSMVRNEFCKTQEYEITYLRYCMPAHLQNLLKNFHDTDFGGIDIACREFNCSINALGQLFFLARILERNNTEHIKTIVEFGGGYGCLARVASMVIPDQTYIIFDLPEYIALQSFYLRSTLPGVKIIVHTVLPETFEQKAIHLVPVFLLPHAKICADIFVSFAAISEAPAFVQKMVIEKKFFNAPSSYITGQLNCWNAQYNFEHHSLVMDGMRACYKLCFAQPLHHFGGPLLSYDIYGTKKR